MSTQPGAVRERTIPPGLVVLLLCLLAAGVHLNSLSNAFALDDYFVIEQNPQVHGIERLGDAVTGAYMPTGPARLGMYRPVTSATYAVDWDLWNGRPFGFHLVNLLLHAAVTALVFVLLSQLGAGLAGAAAGAAVFAVHPVHVEAVANVVGRAEILAAFFFLLGCIAYLRLRPGWRTAALVGLLYLGALLSKEIGVTLPAALPLLHIARGATLETAAAALRERWRVYVVLTVALVVYFVLRWVNIGALLGSGEAPWFWGEPGMTRVWTAIRIFPEYLRLMLAPADLVPDYGPGVIVPEPSWTGPAVLLGFLTALAMVGVVVLAWRSARLLSAGILWFSATVLPVSGLLFAAGVLLAERTLYLPSVGLALGVAGVVAALRAARPESFRALAALLALLVAAGAVRTWVQNPVWRTTDTVLQYLLRTHPANYRAQWLMATYLSRQGNREAALDHFQLAVRMVPGYYNLRSEYGRELFRAGLYDDAAEQFGTATRIVPDLLHAQSRYVESLLLAGRPAEAATAAAEAIDLLPHMAVLHHLRGRAMARLGRMEEARDAQARAAALDRGGARWAIWLNLAALESVTGRPAAAAAALDSATTAAPDSVPIPDIATLERWLETGETAGIPYW